MSDLSGFEEQYPLVAQAIAAVYTGAKRDRWDKNHRDAIELELQLINERKEPLLSALAKHYGTQPLSGPILIQFSLAATEHLGYTASNKEFMARLWVEVLSKWRREEQTAFVQSIADRTGQDIFELLAFAEGVFTHFDFTAEVMLPWLRQVRKVIGNDAVIDGFFKCVAGFSKRCPGEALSVVEQWQAQQPNEQARGVISRMMAYIRCAPGLDHDLRRAIVLFDKTLAAPGTPEYRASHIESWAYMLDNAEASDERLASLASEVYRPGGDEETAWCFLLCQLNSKHPERRDFVYRQLKKIVRTNMPALPRYWAVEAVLHGWTLEQLESVPSREDWASLFLMLQPVPPSDRASWRAIGSFLQRAIKEHANDAIAFITELARAAGRELQQTLSTTDNGLSSFVYTLRESPICSEVVSRLCTASDRMAWRLGLDLFQRCPRAQLDKERLNQCDVRVIEALFREAMVLPLLAEGTARLHTALFPRMHEIGGELLDDFLAEIMHQTLDTHAYRTTISSALSDNPEIAKMVEAAKTRIDATYAARSSPALLMHIPGHGRYVRQWFRRMGKQIHRDTMDTGWMKEVTNVSLLHADTWRIQRADGTLGDAQRLGHVSGEGEMPRLEAMMPEAQTLKRISAEMRLRAIQQDLSGQE